MMPAASVPVWAIHTTHACSVALVRLASARAADLFPLLRFPQQQNPPGYARKAFTVHPRPLNPEKDDRQGSCEALAGNRGGEMTVGGRSGGSEVFGEVWPSALRASGWISGKPST